MKFSYYIITTIVYFSIILIILIRSMNDLRKIKEIDDIWKNRKIIYRRSRILIISLIIYLVILFGSDIIEYFIKGWK